MRSRQSIDELRDVRYRPLHSLFIELKRLSDVVEDAEIVDNQAVGLLFAIRAVRPADRLQQRMVAQRLVQIHGLQNRRVEACQQFRRYDDDLQRVLRIAEPVEQLFLGIAVALVGGILGFAAVNRHHDIRHFRGQVSVEFLLIEQAALAVEGHYLRAEAVRGDLLLEVFGDVTTYGTDSLGRFYQDRHLGGSLTQPIPVLVG
jgi:hypothetical protein